MSERVSAIIPNWNGGERLQALLESIHRQSRKPDEVLVIDGNSTDASTAVARAHGARVIPLSRNRGFAVAVNVGVRAARFELLAILNNDVVLHEEWLERMHRALVSSKAWFAAGKVLRSDGGARVVDGSFDLLSRSGCAWRAGHGRPDGETFSCSRKIWIASMTATLMKAELFRLVGELDERFESYGEDVEFGLRCALKGCEGVFVPEAVAFHAGSQTLGAWSAEVVRLISRNQVFLVAKHFPGTLLRKYAWHIIAGQLLWGMAAARRGRASPWLKGKWEGLKRFKELQTRGMNSDVQGLEQILEANEKELARLQQELGFDRFWRSYFLVT